MLEFIFKTLASTLIIFNSITVIAVITAIFKSGSFIVSDLCFLLWLITSIVIGVLYLVKKGES